MVATLHKMRKLNGGRGYMVPKIIQVPYEEGCFWRKGTKMGPESIVRCLKELREYSIDLNSMISWNVSELLGEIVDINPYSKKESLKNIYDTALKVWKTT